MNGKTINTTATLFNIYGSYNLTIKDSEENGAVNCTANKLIYASGSGTIKIEGGTLSTATTSGHTYVIYLSGFNFEMTGGTLKIPETSTPDYNYCLNNGGAGNVTISNGTFLGKASGGNYVISNTSSGNVYISGGNFEGYYGTAG